MYFLEFQAAALHNQLVLQQEIRDLKSIVLRNINLTAPIIQNQNVLWPIKSELDFITANEALTEESVFNHQVITHFTTQYETIHI